MTEPTPQPADSQLVLPGLDEPSQLESPLELAARRTLTALAAERELGESDALTCQLVLDLSASIAAGRRAGRASAVAMAAAQLLACIERLDPVDLGGGEDDADRQEWARLVEEMRTAGSPPAGGHPTDRVPLD